MSVQASSSRGFTLLELLVVLAIIGILAAVVLANLSDTRDAAYEARAQSEFRHFTAAMYAYLAENNWEYPADVDRGIPSGLENYLSSDDWPNGPWSDSVYDWDAWDIPSEGTVHQLSIRFCPQGGPLSACTFPNTAWAENFDVNSAYFYCFEGPCRSHPNEPRGYPGYCQNCECKQMEVCH